MIGQINEFWTVQRMGELSGYQVVLKEKLVKVPARYHAAFPEGVGRKANRSSQGPLGPHLRIQAGFGIWNLENY